MSNIVRTISVGKLKPLLRNKSNATLHELNESPESIPSITYPAPWADPFTLSKTNAYHITREHKLPTELETLAQQYSPENIRVYSNQDEQYVAMTTPDCISMYFYNEQSDNRLINLSCSGLSVNDGNTPFFNSLSYNNNNKVSVLATGTKGEIHYWKDCTVDTWLHYEIPLLSSHEQITVVHTLNRSRYLVGSSTGEIYYLHIKKNNVVEASTFYNHTGFTSRIQIFFYRKPLPHQSDVVKPNTAGPILNINTIGNDLYFVSSKYIALWRIHNQGVKLVSRIDVESEVTASVAQHIPPNVSKEYIKSQILDMSVYSRDEIVVLASYSVPDMGEYVQYAITTFSLEFDEDNNNIDTNTSLYVKHTASIPYSAIPATLKTMPKLSITDSLAFVIFDQAVMAVSLDRRSVFEESVVLNGRDDYVLHTDVGINDQNVDTAVIYTLKSGIIKFQVDTSIIKASRTTGNIYAGVVDDILERDTLVFKFKLEQAVFFGAAEGLPLQFPLRAEQEDVSAAVISLSKDILNEECQFLPAKMDIDLYIESRYTFAKRIMTVLRDNDLLNMISEESRFELMREVEHYYLAVVLWEIYKERPEGTTSQYWAAKMKAITGLEIDYHSQVENFLRNNVIDIVEFVSKLTTNVAKQAIVKKEHLKLFCNTDEDLLRVTRKAKLFEEKYMPAYGLEQDFDMSISVQFRDMLFGLFQVNADYIKDYNENISTDNDDAASNLEEMKEKMSELATLLLDTLLEAATSQKMTSGDDELVYESMREPVVVGLCNAGVYEKAIDLAGKHNDIPSVVASVQSSKLSPETIKEKNIHFIHLFKNEYFDCLLRYLEDHSGTDGQAVILELCPLYPEYADSFFERNESSAAWVYYLRQKKDYKKSLASLKALFDKELTVKQRKEMLNWIKMLYVSANKHLGDDILESAELMKISTNLDFEKTQMDIIKKFQDHLQFNTSEENKTAFIFRQCASVLYNSERTAEIEEMKQSITMLLDEVSIKKKQVIKMLIMLDNVGSDIENVYTAIELVHQMRIEGDNHYKQLLSMIWKEVYIRDLNSRYLQNLNNNKAYTDIQKGVALQETCLYRIMNICKSKKVQADEILSPGSLILTETDKDVQLNQKIVTPEFSTFFMNVIAALDGKTVLTYEELEDSLKKITQ